MLSVGEENDYEEQLNTLFKLTHIKHIGTSLQVTRLKVNCVMKFVAAGLLFSYLKNLEETMNEIYYSTAT